MNQGKAIVVRYSRQMRVYQLARYTAYALPLFLVLVYTLPRSGYLSLAGSALVALVFALFQVLVTDLALRRKRVSFARVLAHLDRRFPSLEDSSELLARPLASLSPLQRLQLERIDAAVVALAERGQLEASGSRRLPRAVAVALLIGALGINAIWLVPAWQQRVSGAQVVQDAAPMIADVVADIRPPTYTGLSASRQSGASVAVKEFSELRFTVTLFGNVGDLSLVTGDGMQISLYPAGDGRWQSIWWQPVASTYRFIADGDALPVADAGLVHTIAVAADRAPVVEILAPASRLQTVSEQSADPLSIRLAIDDDFGVQQVVARITRSSGSGEQVAFEDQQVVMFEATDSAPDTLALADEFDPVALGLSAGSELYLHFEAGDGRPGGANIGKSQTLIVRWQGEQDTPDIVLDNQVVQVMPEYFRSQRQIIIDSEALIAERESIEADIFNQRAQSLALDQKALRLRYGEFMGEEDDSEPSAMPTESSDGEGHYAGDGHDHADEDFVAAAQPRASAFGDVEAAIEPYAHFHDQEEQATLFDPETRGLLRQALAAMWQSEGELRQFRPQPALPHQYQALALIKRVQNRSRAYVARVGFEPTPVDPQRRLTGELDDISRSARLASQASGTSDAALLQSVLSLLESDALLDDDAVARVETWLARKLGEARAGGDDALVAATLDAAAALEQWGLDADCDDCRARLSGYWQRHAPPQRAPAARAEQPFDAFTAETGGGQ